MLWTQESLHLLNITEQLQAYNPTNDWLMSFLLSSVPAPTPSPETSFDRLLALKGSIKEYLEHDIVFVLLTAEHSIF